MMFLSVANIIEQKIRMPEALAWRFILISSLPFTDIAGNRKQSQTRAERI